MWRTGAQPSPSPSHRAVTGRRRAGQRFGALRRRVRTAATALAVPARAIAALTGRTARACSRRRTAPVRRRTAAVADGCVRERTGRGCCRTRRMAAEAPVPLQLPRPWQFATDLEDDAVRREAALEVAARDVDVAGPHLARGSLSQLRARRVAPADRRADRPFTACPLARRASRSRCERNRRRPSGTTAEYSKRQSWKPISWAPWSIALQSNFGVPVRAGDDRAAADGGTGAVAAPRAPAGTGWCGRCRSRRRRRGSRSSRRSGSD